MGSDIPCFRIALAANEYVEHFQEGYYLTLFSYSTNLVTTVSTLTVERKHPCRQSYISNVVVTAISLGRLVAGNNL